MAQLLVRGLPAKTLRRLKERAARNRRSLESEAREVLNCSASMLSSGEARIVSEEWHKRFAGREFGDSAEIIRREREARIERINRATRR